MSNIVLNMFTFLDVNFSKAVNNKPFLNVNIFEHTIKFRHRLVLSTETKGLVVVVCAV